MKITYCSKVCEDQKIESDFGIELEAIARVLGKRGVKIEPIQPSLIRAFQLGKLWRTSGKALEALSDAEKQIISTRTRSALKIKKGKNERVGHIPFGQKLAKDGIHLESNYEELEVINQIALLHAKGLSVRKIAQIMNLNKMFNRFGTKWNHESIHQLTKKIARQKL